MSPVARVPGPAGPAPGPALVRVDGVTKRYGRTAALAGASFTAAGGVVALLGPNGAGKTTLLRGLATVLPPDSGSIHVDGLDVAHPHQRVAIRRRLGYLPQEVAFAPAATVFDVVDYVGIVRLLGPPSRRHARVIEALRAVGLADRAHTRVRDLSGGMRQRLGIAQAILGRPPLLVLDEPAQGLDPEQRIALRTQLSDLGRSTTVVVSTHLLEEAAAMSQVLHVLDRGRIVYSGLPAGLAATARGRVWTSVGPPGPSPDVRASWRLPDGRHRTVGPSVFPGAEPAEPALEDGYLLLVAGGTAPAPGSAPAPGGFGAAGGGR